MKRPDLFQAVLASVVSLSLAPAPAGVNAAGTDIAAPTPGRGTYANPLPVSLADPCILRHEGTYYLYGTSAPSQGFLVWTSRDLVRWESHPFAFRRAASA